MVDMDEYLYVINDTLKSYLSNKIFDKCDFIKIHWANSQDNNLLHYDPRPLFQRFKMPYIYSKFIKTTIIFNQFRSYKKFAFVILIKIIILSNSNNFKEYIYLQLKIQLVQMMEI